MDAHALDFWLGEWDCAWDGGSGTNTITRGLGGAVVVERFEALEPDRWSGMSVSVFDPSTEGWRQTWVDSNGSYWHFVGGLVHGDLAFATPESVDAEATFKRMVFSVVTPDGFEWRWERSADDATWEPRWAITYRRRSATSPLT
ncbi:MAG: hypothetical protein ACXWF5_09575 [Actinomycetota bacterium]